MNTEGRQMLSKRIRVSTILVSIVFLLSCYGSTLADTIEYTGSVTISSTDFPADIAVGDIFHVSLTYDDSDTDTNPAGYGGRFNYALLTFDVTRDPGNTGTWDPAGGIWDINPSNNHVTNANGDNMTIQNQGTGFDPLGGFDFCDAAPTWQWDTSVHDIMDTGIGQTLRNQFGEVSPNFLETENSQFEIRNGDYSSASGTLVFNASPTPTPTQTPCLHTGDCTLNGSVTAEDAQMAFLITLGSVIPDSEEFCAADCDGGGTVTAGDAQQIFLVVLGSGTCVDPV